MIFRGDISMVWDWGAREPARIVDITETITLEQGFMGEMSAVKDARSRDYTLAT